MKKIGIGLLAVLGLFFITACGREEKTYEVVFSNDGGRTVITIKEGEKVTKPTDPVKEGYTFAGWFTNLNSANAYDFDKEVKSNFTLYAKWVKDAVCTLTCPEGFELVNPESANCSCQKNEDKESDKPVVVEKVTVKFDSNGGSKVKSKTVTIGKTVNKPTEPTKTDYKFVGWYLNGQEYNFKSKVTKNITLVAKWEKVESKPSTPSTPEEPEENKDVLGYEEIPEKNTSARQVRIYLTKNGERVAGTADIVYINGKTATVEFPITGIQETDDIYEKIINIKVD